MKKAILSTALLSAVFLGSIQVASAAEVATEKTPVGIEFEKTSEVGEGPFKGALSLTYKPSALEFGKFKASGAMIDAPAVNISDDNKQWLVINDDRENTAPVAGGDATDVKGGTWKLTAKMDELKDASGKTLPAKLTMNFGGIQNYTMGTEINKETGDINPANPNGTGVVKPFEEDKTPKIDLTSAVILEAGSTTTETPVMAKKEATTEKVGVASQLTSANLNVQTKGYDGGKLASQVTWTLSTGI